MGLTMNLIVLKWVERHVDIPFATPFFDKEMKVVYSAHPEHKHGEGFDFSNIKRVADDGYQVIIIP